MNRRRILAVILTVVILAVSTAGGYTKVSAETVGRISQKKDTKKVKWPEGPKKKSLSSDSAIVMELSTGQILYKKNMNKKHYPASITKILTTMLTAENCSDNEVVNFSETAVYGIESGSSTVFTEVHEKLTIEQCLYAIMLESANEVCLGVAEYISGSIKAFVDKMNERVKELGLKGTHFNNPNGLPDPKHYTTAYDMAVIAREAMKNPTFRKVASTKSYRMPATNKHQPRIWNNHHQMINGYEWPKYEYKYCIGGKTGYTDAARYTLVTFAEKDGMELVCVVMRAGGPKQGEPNEYTDTTTLLNYGFGKYKKYTIDEQTSDINKDLFNNYDSYFDSGASPIHLASESSVVLPKGVKLSQAKQKIFYNKGTKIEMGDNIIGHVTYTYDDRTVGSTDIIYTKSEDFSDKHLDAASREVVDEEIQQLKESEKKDKEKENVWRKWRKVTDGMIGVFQIEAVQIALLVIAAVVILAILIFLLRHIHLPGFRRRRRHSSGGYRSRRARRRNARKSHRHWSNKGSSKRRRSRRNMSKYYERKPSNTETARKRRNKGLMYHKNHKKTKESFGKNFFDF